MKQSLSASKLISLAWSSASFLIDYPPAQIDVKIAGKTEENFRIFHVDCQGQPSYTLLISPGGGIVQVYREKLDHTRMKLIGAGLKVSEWSYDLNTGYTLKWKAAGTKIFMRKPN